MTSNRLGLKFIAVAAATFLVAACSEKPAEVKKDSAANEQAQGNNNSNENISRVKTQQLTSEQLMKQEEVAKWSTADDKGLKSYAGDDRVFFSYDSDVLTDDARQVLQKQAEWLLHYTNVSVSIEGHCDERGTRDYNLALGDRRAIAVKNYLLALDVPAHRLSTISYGKERPVEVGNGEGVWSQNRRGVLVVK